MAAIRQKIKGMEGLLRNLERLDKRARGPIIRKAVRAGGKKIVDLAKSKVPVDKGWLKKSLAQKVKVRRQKGDAISIIGPQSIEARDRKTGKTKITGFGKRIAKKTAEKINPVRYAHLVENGHGGPSPAPPHPFLRPAVDQGSSSARDAMADKVRSGIAEAIQ